jgi:hypothetical protein
MRYIKSFNESNQIKSDLFDICLELIDIGWKFDIKPVQGGFNELIMSDPNLFTTNQHRLIHGLKWEDMEDYILRIKDYLGEKFFSVSIISQNGLIGVKRKVFNYNFNSKELNSDKNIEGFIGKIRIYYLD